MKLLSKFKLGLVTVTIASLAALTLASNTSAAGSATFSLSPASGSYNVGAEFEITISENSGSDQVNAVQADLTYDPSKLQFVGINSSGSAFSIEAEAFGGGGSVRIGRGSVAAYTGNQLVSKVTFKTLAGSGTTSISFASSSAIVRAGDSENVWNGSTSGGNYTLTTPPGQAPPPASPSAPKPTKPVSPNNAAPIADDQPVPVSPATGITGYLVAIKLTGLSPDKLVGVEVKLDDKSAVTDQTGIAGFSDVAPGEHTIKALGTSQQITVAEGNNTSVQTFNLDVQSKEDQNRRLLPYAIGGGALIAFVLLVVIISKTRPPSIRSLRRGGGSAPKVPPQNPEIASINANMALGSQKPDTVIRPEPGNLPQDGSNSQ